MKAAFGVQVRMGGFKGILVMVIGIFTRLVFFLIGHRQTSLVYSLLKTQGCWLEAMKVVL